MPAQPDPGERRGGKGEVVGRRARRKRVDEREMGKGEKGEIWGHGS